MGSNATEHLAVHTTRLLDPDNLEIEGNMFIGADNVPDRKAVLRAKLLLDGGRLEIGNKQNSEDAGSFVRCES